MRFILLGVTQALAAVILKSSLTGKNVIPFETQGKHAWMEFDINKHTSELASECPPFVSCVSDLRSVKSVQPDNVPINILFDRIQPLVDTTGILGLSPRSQLTREYDVRFFTCSEGQTAVAFAKRSRKMREPSFAQSATWELKLDGSGFYGMPAELTMYEEIVIPSERFATDLPGLFLLNNGENYYSYCDEVKLRLLEFKLDGSVIRVPVRLKAGEEFVTSFSSDRPVCPTNLRLDKSDYRAKIRIGIPLLAENYDVVLGGGVVKLLKRRLLSSSVKLFDNIPLFKLGGTTVSDKNVLKHEWVRAFPGEQQTDMFRLVSFKNENMKVQIELELIGKWANGRNLVVRRTELVSVPRIEYSRNRITVQAHRQVEPSDIPFAFRIYPLNKWVIVIIEPQQREISLS
jgi:hypothetical protein